MSETRALTPRRLVSMKQALALAGFLAISYLAGVVGVVLMGSEPGAWYAALAKPAWTPPGAFIGAVWNVLYALMGVAAWLVWRAEGWRGAGRALGVFVVQLVVNAAWSGVFFRAHALGAAFVTIVVLDALVLATMYGFWRVRPVAGALLVPYFLWALFATALNGAIWAMNV